jgi:hypothetical protein
MMLRSKANRLHGIESAISRLRCRKMQYGFESRMVQAVRPEWPGKMLLQVVLDEHPIVGRRKADNIAHMWLRHGSPGTGQEGIKPSACRLPKGTQQIITIEIQKLSVAHDQSPCLFRHLRKAGEP